MPYGPLPQDRIPKQDPERLLLLLDRWQRAAGAMQKWAEKAKEAVDFLEGRQWGEKDLARLNAQGRPALTINKTNRLVRLMMGYFSNNRVDLRYLPGDDAAASEAIADILTKIAKQISEQNQLSYVDMETFLDGLVTGRGYYDSRMDFEHSDFGEAVISAVDPFTVYIDPDAQEYDLNKGCGYVTVSRMASIDEVEALYGRPVRQEVEPFVYGHTPTTMYHTPFEDETTPVRRFGHSEDSYSEWWDNIYNRLGSFTDTARKSLRIIDTQYIETKAARIFVDLETGDRKEIPPDWDDEKIAKTVWFAESRGSPVMVDHRPVKKVRWTHIIGDLIVYDRWSPYSTYTINGYFPYFRRGIARGMVEDLMDPNREINKRRSARIDAVMRGAHSGWKYHERSLSPQQKHNLKAHGAEAGFNLEWRGDPRMKPEKIEASAPPQGLRELEGAASDDMLEVSGINESALGQLDVGQSGRAIEARQRQSVIAVQMYLTNFSRSKELQGRKILELVQEHYTEPRLFRIMGESGTLDEIRINQRAEGIAEITNNIMLGKYRVLVDERPLAASFESAQWEEMKDILATLGPLGQMLASMRPDLVVGMSSLPRKEEFQEALLAAAQAMQLGAVPPGGGAPSPPPPPGARQASPDGPGAGPSPAPGVAPPGSNVVALPR